MLGYLESYLSVLLSLFVTMLFVLGLGRCQCDKADLHKVFLTLTTVNFAVWYLPLPGCIVIVRLCWFVMLLVITEKVQLKFS